MSYSSRVTGKEARTYTFQPTDLNRRLIRALIRRRRLSNPSLRRGLKTRVLNDLLYHGLAAVGAVRPNGKGKVTK